MKKMFSLLSITLLMACSQGPASVDPAAAVPERTVDEVAITQGSPMAYAEMEIGGMSCTMMCARMIKGALDELPGITEADVEYNEGDEFGHAKVSYDPAKVDDARIIEAVQALADGAYNVSSIHIRKEVKNEPAAHRNKQTNEDGRSVSLMPDAHMPNLISTLLGLVRV